MEHTYLIHSKKGSQWKNHKYIKKVGNKYYYKDTEINKDTKDEDIIKNSLGKDFDEVRKKVIAKQKETGRTDLTDDEIKEILGDKYDEVKERLTDQAAARDEVSGKNKKKSEKTDDTEKKSSKGKSSSGSSKSSGGSSSGSKSSGGSSGGSSSGSKSSGGSSKSSGSSSNSSSQNASKPSTTDNTKKPTSFKSKNEAAKFLTDFRQKYGKILNDKSALSKINHDELKKYYMAKNLVKGTGTKKTQEVSSTLTTSNKTKRK